jgi:hypothetical protein
VGSPIIPLNEISRMQRKISKKFQQLPRDKPGLIVITTDENLLFFMHSVQEILQAVIERVSRYPYVVAVVLTHAFIGGRKESLVANSGQHLYARHTLKTLVTEQAVMVRNSAATLSVAASTYSALQSAYSNPRFGG